MRGGVVLILLLLDCIAGLANRAYAMNDDTMIVRKTNDFIISGKGDNEAWNKTSWLKYVNVESGGKHHESRSKILYSEKGIYILFEGGDDSITTKNYNDDDEIYEGDVFEFFLQTEKGKPYFEYEINHLGKQLILTLSGKPHNNLAWSPWGHEYKKRPQIQSKVVVKDKQGRELKDVKPGSAISSWIAEVFLPYEIISLLPHAIPKAGTIWWGNFCRMDYDNGKIVEWTWSKKIKSNFHELKNFGVILFE